MLPMDKRYTVLVGNYGSGKTELAIAIARTQRAREPEGRIALVDLDIVNPYFRSAEQHALLEAEGIEVFMPSFAMSTVDIPALPAQIQAVFEQPYAHVVIDVGGDDTGATALGRYAPYTRALRDEMNVLYVVNPCRPFSSSVEDITGLYRLIERQARLTPRPPGQQRQFAGTHHPGGAAGRSGAASAGRRAAGPPREHDRRALAFEGIFARCAQASVLCL